MIVMKKISMILALFSALLLCGCSTTVRKVSTIHHEGNYGYFAYWEGECSDWMGCSTGQSRIKRCNINDDNTATCVDETAANRILNPHQGK